MPRRPSDTLLPFDQRTIKHLLEARARSSADRPGLRILDQTFTAAGLNQAVNRVAHGLLAHGVDAASTVALFSSTNPEMIIMWLALAKIGAVCVPLNAAARAPQLAYMLTNSKATALAIASDCFEEFEGIDCALPDLKRLVLLGPDSRLTVRTDLEVLDVAQLDRQSFSEADLPVEVSPMAIASIMYTGGTTGPSKGVLCSQSQYYWWARLLGKGVRLTEGDVWYTCLPFFHINAQATFLATVLAGASTVASGRFSATRYLDDARNCGATIGSLLGTMAHILYHKTPASAQDRQHTMRAVFCPACPGLLQIDFEHRFGVKVLNAYGSTELNCVTITPLDEATRPGSMGRVLDEFELRVVDDNDEQVSAGSAGELLVRPREPFSIMSGYCGMPGQTVEAWRNLWFHTGDRAVRDEHGHCYFVDRLKDVIRRRGENIASFDVEQVVNGHQAVLESAAYPVPAEVGEDEVMISVVPRQGAQVDLPALIQWCRERLPYFAVPRFVEIVDDLPKTAVGRVEKFKLRKQGVRPTTWDRERRG